MQCPWLQYDPIPPFIRTLLEAPECPPGGPERPPRGPERPPGGPPGGRRGFGILLKNQQYGNMASNMAAGGFI